MRKFYCINDSLWTNNIRNVRNSCTACSSQIEHLSYLLSYLITRINVYAWDSPDYRCSYLWPIRIPDSVLDFLVFFGIHGYSLLIINRFSWDHIKSHQRILLTLSYKNSWKSVWNNYDLSWTSSSFLIWIWPSWLLLLFSSEVFNHLYFARLI